MPDWQFMDSDLKKSINRLKEEIKNDFYFFTPCGFLVSILLVWQDPLKKLGIFENQRWASDLFNDFLSWRAFAFVFFIYALLGFIFSKSGYKSKRLENILSHINDRLRQFGSSIICFTAGFSLFLLGLLIGTADSSVARALFITVLFFIFISAAIILIELFVRHQKIFDRDFLIVSIVFTVTYFAIRQVGS